MEYCNPGTKENQSKFVRILKEFPILFTKSVLPDIQRKKVVAIKEVVYKLKTEMGISMSETQVSKKLQNMISRVNEKSHRLGKSDAELKVWEQELLNYIEDLESISTGNEITNLPGEDMSPPDSQSGEAGLACLDITDTSEGENDTLMEGAAGGHSLRSQGLNEDWECNIKPDLDTKENKKKLFTIIMDYPALIEKSQLARDRKRTTEAMREVKCRVLSEIGVSMSEAQVWKKIKNMKTRLKYKVQMKRSGKKNVKVRVWEQKFLGFLKNAEDFSLNNCNHVSETLTTSDHCDVGFVDLDENLDPEDDSQGNKPDVEIQFYLPNGHQASEGESTLNITDEHAGQFTSNITDEQKEQCLPNIDDTKHLSTPELERLVLLEQLQYYREARQLLEMQMDRELRKTRCADCSK